jgi:hypothetical protein
MNRYALALAATLSLGLSACAGGGPVSPEQHALDTAKAEFRSCWDGVSHRPEYSNLRAHVPDLAGDSPTLAQRADPGVPTEADAQAILAWDHDMQSCITPLVAAEGNVDALLGNAARERFSDEARVYAALVQRRITWGGANQALEAVGHEDERRWQNALAIINARMEQAAMARAAALGGLANAFSAAGASMRRY